MPLAVHASIRQLKILRHVVELVVIDVVDMFRRVKRSPESLLHNMPVFSNLLPFNSNESIATLGGSFARAALDVVIRSAVLVPVQIVRFAPSARRSAYSGWARTTVNLAGSHASF